MLHKILLVGSALLSYGTITFAGDFSGSVGLESRYFSYDSELQSSISFVPEYYWEGGSNALAVKAFARYDDMDDERTHTDLRELMWLHVSDSWELHLGVGKVFWGVTESVHLVDIINQTDFVESVDGEEKLGQPMVRWSGIYNWGVIDAFILPQFRAQVLPGAGSVLGGGFPAVLAQPLYESGAEEKHVDVAFRYSHSVGSWDAGLSFFNGTNRDPHFIPVNNTEYLQVYYSQIQQVSLDLQATLDGFLFKLEAISRQDSIKDYAAISAGTEYTFVGLNESAVDLGLLAELHRDSRNERATAGTQNDAFVGLRFSLNDIQDTSVLMGISQDLKDSSSNTVVLEASRRLGDTWRVTIDGLLLNTDNPRDPLYPLRDKDHLNLSLEYFF